MLALQIVTLETALQTSGALKPHMMVAAVPRHGQELANGLLQDDSSTSDKRHGLQLLKVGVADTRSQVGWLRACA